MSWLILLQIALTALQAVATAANKEGLTELAAIVQAAIQKLQEVHGSEVTKAQLESLRG